jgi:hypothetical protein
MQQLKYNWNRFTYNRNWITIEIHQINFRSPHFSTVTTVRCTYTVKIHLASWNLCWSLYARSYCIWCKPRIVWLCWQSATDSPGRGRHSEGPLFRHWLFLYPNSLNPNVTVGMEPWRPDPDSPSANDPIEFWLTSNAKYPLLSPFALDIIATPASEAYAERVFSVAGELTVGKRNRTAKNLERRVFLKVNKNT